MAHPEIDTLISEAQSVLSMIRSDLDDLRAGRQPPDGPNGLRTALGRASELRHVLTEIEGLAKRRGLSLTPRVPMPPPSRDDWRGGERLF